MLASAPGRHAVLEVNLLDGARRLCSCFVRDPRRFLRCDHPVRPLFRDHRGAVPGGRLSGRGEPDSGAAVAHCLEPAAPHDAPVCLPRWASCRAGRPTDHRRLAATRRRRAASVRAARAAASRFRLAGAAGAGSGLAWRAAAGLVVRAGHGRIARRGAASEAGAAAALPDARGDAQPGAAAARGTAEIAARRGGCRRARRGPGAARPRAARGRLGLVAVAPRRRGRVRRAPTCAHSVTLSQLLASVTRAGLLHRCVSRERWSAVSLPLRPLAIRVLRLCLVASGFISCRTSPSRRSRVPPSPGESRASVA